MSKLLEIISKYINLCSNEIIVILIDDYIDIIREHKDS